MLGIRNRRGWAKAGLVLGSLLLVLIPTVLALSMGRLRLVVEALSKLQYAK